MGQGWSSSHRKARKVHYCTLCGRDINKGETYLRGTGFDGTAWSWKECAHCEKARALYYDQITDDSEYSWESFAQWSHDTSSNLSEVRSKAGFRHQWRTAQGNLWPMPERAPVDNVNELL